MRNHLDGKVATVVEWIQRLPNDTGVEIERGKRNYGKTEHVSIYYPSGGVLLSQE